MIIITRGAGHQICEPLGTTVSALDTVVEDSGFDGWNALVLGKPDSGHKPQLICGQFAFDPGAKHVLVDSLPDYVLVKDYGKASPDWLDSTLRMIGAELGHEKLGGDLIVLKLSEIIFTQASESAAIAGLPNSGSARTSTKCFNFMCNSTY